MEPFPTVLFTGLTGEWDVYPITPTDAHFECLLAFVFLRESKKKKIFLGHFCNNWDL